MSASSRFYLFAGLAIVLAAALAPFASKSPDGLDKIAQDQGFAEREAAPMRTAWFHDYTFPGVHNEYVSTALAGLLGVALVFGLARVTGAWLARKSATDADEKRP